VMERVDMEGDLWMRVSPNEKKKEREEEEMRDEEGMIRCE
jgi:hypothetical protein